MATTKARGTRFLADSGPKPRSSPFRRFLDPNKRTHHFSESKDRLNKFPGRVEGFWAFLTTFGRDLALARQGGGTPCRAVFGPKSGQNRDSRRFADFWTLTNARTPLKGA